MFYSKHADTTLQVLGKVLGYSSISTKSPDYSDSQISQTNDYNTLCIALQDKLLNLPPLFTSTWLSDAFITLFGYLCYILTQCGIYIYISFLTNYHDTYKIFKLISIKHNLKQIITLLRSIAHGFFKIITAEMVIDLKDSQRTLPPNKSSYQLSTIIENPSDDSSDNSDDPIKTSNNSSRCISPTLFFTTSKTTSKHDKIQFIPKTKKPFKSIYLL